MVVGLFASAAYQFQWGVGKPVGFGAIVAAACTSAFILQHSAQTSLVSFLMGAIGVYGGAQIQ